MNIYTTVDKLTPDKWSELSEKAHLICFNEKKPRDIDRIDFALIARYGNDILGYVTCREHDSQTVYWQFGGAFPGTKDTVKTWFGYQAFARYCKEHYKRVTTLIENDNIVMLKMAMKLGFRIQGIRFFNGDILLEHLLEFHE